MRGSIIRRVAALIAMLLALTACGPGDGPDPFGGCNQHPGQCGRTR